MNTETNESCGLQYATIIYVVDGSVGMMRICFPEYEHVLDAAERKCGLTFGAKDITFIFEGWPEFFSC